MDIPGEMARHRARMPEGTETLLNTRTLWDDHRRLAQVLRPGMSVLDVGCGTGAITRGIAEAVGPEGRVVGVDMNSRMIAQAREANSDLPGLTFEVGDIYHLPFADAFDLITAARVLQWLQDPGTALQGMVRAAKPGGRILVLDYNHEQARWEPDLPATMQQCYAAFLRWRAESGMDNAIADRLADLFADSGLTDIAITPQHEATQRGDRDFPARLAIWAEVAAHRGPQMVADGYLTEVQRATAETEYRRWMGAEALSQTLYLLAVEGVRPEKTV